MAVEFNGRPVSLAGAGGIGGQRGDFFLETHRIHDAGAAGGDLVEQGANAAGVEGADSAGERAFADITKVSHAAALHARTRSPHRAQTQGLLPLRRTAHGCLHLGQRSGFKIGTDDRAAQTAWAVASVMACAIVRVENLGEWV